MAVMERQISFTETLAMETNPLAGSTIRHMHQTMEIRKMQVPPQGLQPVMTNEQFAECERLLTMHHLCIDDHITSENFQQVLDHALGVINLRLTGNRDRDIDIILFRSGIDLTRHDQVYIPHFMSTLQSPTQTWPVERQSYDFQFIKKLLTKLYEGDEQMTRKISEYKYWPPPVAMICISMLQIGAFFASTGDGGDPALSYRTCCRHEVWRFVTYAFVHLNTGHLWTNMIFQVLIGFFLEIMHGPLQTVLLYGAGVFVGCLFASLLTNSQLDSLSGSSGGAYALFGGFIVHVSVNFKRMTSPLKWILVVFVGGLATAALVVNLIIAQPKQTNAEGTVACHGAGLLAGIAIAIALFLKFQDNTRGAIFKLSLSFTTTAWLIFTLFFHTFSNLDERGVCDLNVRCVL